MKTYMLMVLLTASPEPFSVAFQPLPVPRLCLITESKSTHVQSQSGVRSVLYYRDHVEDAEGLVAGLDSAPSPSPSKGHEPYKNGVHVSVVRSLLMSQGLLLAVASIIASTAMATTGHPVNLNVIHWNGADNSFYSLFDPFHQSGWSALQGALAAVPMIYLGDRIEKSDRRDMTHVNFSTMNMVMTLFGRRLHEHPSNTTNISDHQTFHPETPMVHALLLSALLAPVTALSEEVVFRGMIPSAIHYLTRSIPLALVGQAILFGLGHVSPKASHGENRVVGALQSASALWYGLLYQMSGGNIFPCIIAHALYDMHIFMETWMRVNDQMDYTETAVLQRLSSQDEIDIRRIKHEAGASLTVETLALLRRFFYAFDEDHVGRLTRSNVQRAVSYAFLQDSTPPSQEKVDLLIDKLLASRVSADHGEFADRLKLPEFLRLVLFLKATGQQKAVAQRTIVA